MVLLRTGPFFVVVVCLQLASLLLLLQAKDVSGASSLSDKVKNSFDFIGAFLIKKHFRKSSSDSKHSKNSKSSLLKHDGISVVGAGFPRTGTKSIEKALQMMGHEVYDIRAIVQYGHSSRWAQAAHQWKNDGNVTEIELLLQEIEQLGYTVTLDSPMYLFAPAIAQLRPNSKVLLSVRDSVDQWYKSYYFMYRLFVPLFICRPWKWFSTGGNHFRIIINMLADIPQVEVTYPEHLARPLPWYETFLPIEDPQIRDAYKKHYVEFQKHIQDTVPPERLLVYNVKQGWEPWIPFFELQDAGDIIDFTTFPFVNDRSTLIYVQKLLDILAIGFPIWVCLFLWIVYWIIKQIITVVFKIISFLFFKNTKDLRAQTSNTNDKKNK